MNFGKVLLKENLKSASKHSCFPVNIPGFSE